jgi:RNA polymerase sigma factor (sigma-70 family)
MDTDADRLPDEVLLARLGTGDVYFTVTFVHRFQRVVFGVAMTVTGDPGTAEDVAQQTFERAWRHAQVYDPRRGTVRAWMTLIARNLAVDVIHTCTSTPVAPGDLSGLLTVMTDTPEQRTGAHEGAAVLRRTLARLPATQARAVAMAGIYRMTAGQIADAEGIPLDTAKTWIRDGTQRLRDAQLPGAALDQRGAGAVVSSGETGGGLQR